MFPVTLWRKWRALTVFNRICVTYIIPEENSVTLTYWRWHAVLGDPGLIFCDALALTPGCLLSSPTIDVKRWPDAPSGHPSRAWAPSWRKPYAFPAPIPRSELTPFSCRDLPLSFSPPAFNHSTPAVKQYGSMFSSVFHVEDHSDFDSYSTSSRQLLKRLCHSYIRALGNEHTIVLYDSFNFQP